MRLGHGVLYLALLAAQFVPCCGRAAPAPEHFRVGAYLTAIHHIDAAAGSFDADLWIWSVGGSPTRDPLQTMEFINSESLTRRLQTVTPRGTLFWRQVKIVGTFRQDWDFSAFPFDRQVLSIAIEDSTDDSAALVYDPDTANTGYAPDASPVGWRIAGMTLQAGVRHYATNFGDPATKDHGADYARLHLAITLKRASLATFLNLSAPLYAAFLLCVVTFLLHQDGWTAVEPRLFLLASALFAVVLNMRSVSTVLGSVHHLTVLDRLHFVVLIDIVAATFIAVAAGVMRDRSVRMPRWFDYACCAVLVLSFAAANAFLITGATAASSTS
jgi:hypothetical protein